MLLRQVELALLFKMRARVALAEGLVLGPFLGELLGETALRRNGPGPSGLLVLRAGRRRGGNLSPLECLVEVVELREDEFAVAVVLGLWAEAAGCRLRCRLRRTAALVVLLPAGTREEPGTLTQGGALLSLVRLESKTLVVQAQPAQRGSGTHQGRQTEVVCVLCVCDLL